MTVAVYRLGRFRRIARYMAATARVSTERTGPCVRHSGGRRSRPGPPAHHSADDPHRPRRLHPDDPRGRL